MRLPLAREGYPFIAGTAIPALLALWAARAWGGTVLWAVALALALLALSVVAFFRDPERRGPQGPELVLAPADGKIIDVGLYDEPSYLGGEALRISIFLSLIDVHVNRYPVSGAVQHRAYEPGRFQPAWRPAAAHMNERSSTGIAAEDSLILVNQIAGLAAKRVVTYANVGDRVRQGERMGLIRFGSRVDVYMPKHAVLEARSGQRARGGITVLARLPEQETKTT